MINRLLPTIVSLVLVSSWMGSTLGAQQPMSSTDLIPVVERKAAPDFHLTDVHGRPVSLSGQKGHVLLLDFWAITCGGCKLELPWYVEFQSKYAHQGLSLIGLDMYGETPEAVRAFALQQHLTYSLAIGTDAIGDSFHLKAMPLTVLIDRHGRIAASHSGVVDKGNFENLIQQLLSEPAVGPSRSASALGSR